MRSRCSQKPKMCTIDGLCCCMHGLESACSKLVSRLSHLRPYTCQRGRCLYDGQAEYYRKHTCVGVKLLQQVKGLASGLSVGRDAALIGFACWKLHGDCFSKSQTSATLKPKCAFRTLPVTGPLNPHLSCTTSSPCVLQGAQMGFGCLRPLTQPQSWIQQRTC